jgi:polyferredoxin
LANKAIVDISISQERNPLYVKLSDGGVRNGYNLKITNKTHQLKNFTITIIEPSQAILKIQNHENFTVNVNAESSFIFKFFLTVPPEILAQNQETQRLINLEIASEDGVEKISVIFITD